VSFANKKDGNMVSFRQLVKDWVLTLGHVIVEKDISMRQPVTSFFNALFWAFLTWPSAASCQDEGNGGLLARSLSNIENALLKNNLNLAEEQFQKGLAQAPIRSPAYTQLLLNYAAFLSSQGRSYPAIRALGDCSSVSAKDIENCKKAIEYYDQGNGFTLPAVVRLVQQGARDPIGQRFVTPALPPRAGTVIPLDSDDDDIAPAPRPASPGLAMLAGAVAGLNAGLSGAGRTNAIPVFNPSIGNVGSNNNNVPKGVRADHCVSIYPDPGSPFPQFHNKCDSMIMVSWCNDEPGTITTCKADRKPQGMTNLNPGKSWPAGYGTIHFRACKGYESCD
jgi:hypothetical protein